MLLFPEGTDNSKGNQAKAHAFAKERGLPQYDHVLHPKTKGFLHIFKAMNEGDTPLKIWDLSIG